MRLATLTMSWIVSPALATALFAQSNVDLTTANLEDLLRMEVRSVSKKEQQLFRTPSAVYVLTNEEIRRSGMTTVPDVLRLVPGLQVAQIDRNKWAVSSRGFNSLWSNKLLVLVDGRVVYSPVSSGVYWDLQDLPLEDIDRIEVIRGPGATLWGANAVNGVINIISKSAQSTQGGLVALSTGSIDNGIVSARYGGKVGQRGSYRLFAKHANRGQSVDEEGRPAADKSHMTQVGFRGDMDASATDSFTLQGAALWGESGQRVGTPLTSYIPAPPGIIQSESPANVGNVLAKWTRTHSARSSMSLQAFWDRSYRLVVGKGEWTQTVDVEFQHRLPIGRRHDLLWGAGQRFWSDREETKFAEYLDPSHSRIRLFNTFVQDEIVLFPRLNLTVGSKLEHNTVAGFEFQPSVRLTFSPTDRQTAWAAVSRAARTPSRIERALHVDFAAVPGPNDLVMIIGLRGNPDLVNEHTTSFEVGYRAEAGPRLMFDAAAFYTRLRDLSEVVPTTTFELTPGPPHLCILDRYATSMWGESAGPQFLVRWQPLQAWRLDASLDLIDTDLHGPALSDPEHIEMLDRNPKHQWRLKSWLTLAKGWQLDATLAYIGRLSSIDVPSYARADVRFGGSVGRNLNLSISGQNLLDDHHREFDGFEGVYLSQARRSGTVKLTVTF